MVRAWWRRFEERPTNHLGIPEPEPPQRCVNVIALTVFISLALALLFVAMFIGDRFSARSGSLEQDSLLPLDGDDSAHDDYANREGKD